MIYYVAHTDLGKAQRITHDLQISDLENCYICPLLVFSELKSGEICKNDAEQLRLDVLSFSDRLIIPDGVEREKLIEYHFAQDVGMEVVRLDENGYIRPAEV